MSDQTQAIEEFKKLLPTEVDLKKLSRRGIVCYALRCAMRVEHLTKFDSVLHEKVMACIKTTTHFCLATNKNTINVTADYADYADYVARVADAAAVDANTNPAAARAATYATYAAANYVKAAQPFSYYSAPIFTHCSTRAAADNAAKAAADAIAHAARAIADVPPPFRADYEKLLILTGHQAGQLGDPIDPGENGPLGPLWPKRSSSNQAINPETKSTPIAIKSMTKSTPTVTDLGKKSTSIHSGTVSLFQKYWWRFVIPTAVIVAGTVVAAVICYWFRLK